MTQEQSEKQQEEHEPLEEYLPRIVDITRRARIEAERRLLESETLARHANVYYACLTTILTMLALVIKADETGFLAFLSATSAVVLTMGIIYATSQNYRLQADRMRGCYTDLQELRIEIDLINEGKDCIDPHPLADCASRYVSIMRSTDNHLPEDYAKVREKLDAKEKPLKENAGQTNAEQAPNEQSADKSGEVGAKENDPEEQEDKKSKQECCLDRGQRKFPPKPGKYYGIRLLVYLGPLLLYCALGIVFYWFSGLPA